MSECSNAIVVKEEVLAIKFENCQPSEVVSIESHMPVIYFPQQLFVNVDEPTFDIDANVHSGLYNIPIAQSFEVKENFQSITVGELTLEGELVVEGQHFFEV